MFVKYIKQNCVKFFQYIRTTLPVFDRYFFISVLNNSSEKPYSYSKKLLS